MDPARFDHWTRRLTSTSSRRAVGLAALGMSFTASLPLETAARKRKKKKKKCKAPRERCGKACCQPGVPCISGACGCRGGEQVCGRACCAPGVPCVNGACGCPTGEVVCELDPQAGPVCLKGDCCPVNCAGDTCCPSGAVCALGSGEALTCTCESGVICDRGCCKQGLTCTSGNCQQCQPGQTGQACGVGCGCVTTIENSGACVNNAALLQCSSCASSADCGAGKICILLPAGSPCSQNKACVVNVCDPVP